MKDVKMLFAVLMVLGLLMGCTAPVAPAAQPGEASAAAEAEENDTLVIGVTVDPVAVEPGFGKGLTAEMVYVSIFDRLAIRRDPDAMPELSVAESLEQIEPRIWQAKIQEGIQFQNGKPLDGAAVQYAFDRIATLDGIDRWYYNQAGIDHVELVDEYTVNIVTEEPAMLLPHMVNDGFTIVEPEYHQSRTLAETATNPMGSGPYRLMEYIKDDRIVLERNEDYWGEKPDFKHVIIRVIPEAAVRLAELEVGNLDIAEKMIIDKRDTLDAMPNVHAAPLTTGRRVYLNIYRTPDTPLADTRVRQAINYAIDVDTIVETLLGGMTERMATPVNPPNHHPDLEPYPYDPEKAKELLAEAGYPDGFEVNLWTSVDRLTQDVEVARAIGDYLSQVGIEANVQPLEWTVYTTRYRKCELDGLWLMSDGPAFHAQGDLQSHSMFSDTFGCTEWDNEEANELYVQLRKETDWDKREELSLRYQELVHEDSPSIVLYREPDLYGVSEDVDWEPRIDGRIVPPKVRKAE